jgi:hypothetical protein
MTFSAFTPFAAFRPFTTPLGGVSELAALIKALFGNDEGGGMWLPGPATCFTDVAGTTAAAENDTVARINDSSGNGNHATQSSADARPALKKTAGGLWYLDFDGVDDFLWNSNAVLYAAGSAYVGWAAQEGSGEADKRLFAEGSSTNANPIYGIGFNQLTSLDRYRLFLRNNENATLLNDNTVGRTTSGPVVGRFVDTGSNMAILENAAPLSNFNYTRSGTFTANRFSIGALLRASAGSWQKMQLFGMVTRTGALTAEQIAQTEALLASRSGATLP